MTRDEMTRWLNARYEEQCNQFPTLRSIPRQQYIAANLPHMMRVVYWVQREAFDAAEAQS